MSVGTHSLQIEGLSGNSYSFETYPIASLFRSDYPAVYAVLSALGGPFRLLYVGQTTDLGGRLAGHHKASCFSRFGATHVAVHHQPHEIMRLRIEADLLSAHTTSCNG